MADERITQLRELPQAALASGDVLPIVDLSASQTKKITVSSLMGAGISLVASGSINLSVLDQNSATKLAAAALASGAVTAPKLAANSSISVGTVAPSGDNFTGRGFFNTSTSALQVFNGSSFQSVTPAVGAGSITGSQIASGTITPGLIASGTLTGAQMAGGTVTYANIQPTASGDVVIGRATTSGTLTEIPCTSAGRAVIGAADTAAQRAAMGLGNIAQASGVWVDGSSFSGTSTGTNTGDQIITLTGPVTGTGSGTIATTIGSGVITASMLAAGALAGSAIGSGSITGDKMADNSVVITAASTPTGNGAFVGQQWVNTATGFEYTWDGSVWQRLHGISTINFSDTSPLTFAATYPDNFSATITVGLDGQASGTVFAAPSGASGVPVFRQLIPADLPIATSGTTGIMQPGSGLEVDGNGVINHSNSIASGAVNGFVFDGQGHIVSATGLTPSDIPELDAAKITTGEFVTDRYADDSVTGAKLADYATALIGNTTPIAQYTGQLFFNSLDRSFYMWDGNVWQPIGISTGGVIYAGNYDASTNTVVSITAQGDALENLIVGSGLPAPSEFNANYYLIVTASGTGTAPAPTTVLEPPDWIISDGETWTEIDLSTAALGQSATSISFTPSGIITGTNVQDAVIQTLNASTNSNTYFYGLSTDTAALPAHTWHNDTNTGLFRPAADRVGVACSGVEVLRMDLLATGGNRRILFAGAAEIATSAGSLVLEAGGTNIESQTIYNATTTAAANIVMNAAGQFRRSTSSLRYKANIETASLDESKAIVSGVRAVQYNSLSFADPSDQRYWGFIAEEVAEIDPRLVQFNTDGQPDSVGYERFVVPLLQVVQDQQARIEALEARLTALEGS